MSDRNAARVVYLVRRWHWRGNEHDTADGGADDLRPDGLPPPPRGGERRLGGYPRAAGEGGLKGRAAVARALNNALAGRGYGDGDAPGPTDLAWLDDRLGHMDGLTAEQRSNCWMGLLGVAGTDFPGRDGERDHYAVERKWRDWW